MEISFNGFGSQAEHGVRNSIPWVTFYFLKMFVIISYFLKGRYSLSLLAVRYIIEVIQRGKIWYRCKKHPNKEREGEKKVFQIMINPFKKTYLIMSNRFKVSYHCLIKTKAFQIMSNHWRIKS